LLATCANTDRGQPHPLPKYHPQHIKLLRSKSHTNADLVGTLRNPLRPITPGNAFADYRNPGGEKPMRIRPPRLKEFFLPL
jgi:hypothetical protein